MPLRIIGGDLRRRLLRTPQTRDTRPYTDRVRQVVFDRLGDRVEGSRVADIFAGVGTMGLESISRGASSCVFIEGDRRVHECLRENVATLAADHPTVCWKTDIHRTSFRPTGADECLPYSLVFLDPPYAQCPLFEGKQPLAKCMVRLAKPEATADNVLVILRTPEHFEFSATAQWQIHDHWRISTMNLWLLHKEAIADSANALPSAEQQTSETSPADQNASGGA